jgi:hypothetical protein
LVTFGLRDGAESVDEEDAEEPPRAGARELAGAPPGGCALGRLAVRRLVRMAVGPDGGLEVGVPKLLLYEVDRFAAREPDRCGGVSKIVEADVSQVCVAKRSEVPAIADVVREHAGPDARGEDDAASAAAGGELLLPVVSHTCQHY